MRWIEKPCNLVNYELKCSKRLVELPGKCTKEWMVQQPYPCALTSTVEECTVQDIQVSDQCTKSVVKPVSFDCVKETLETYCEGQLEFITLPQTAVRPPPKDQESWKKNKLPLKVLRKLVEVNQGEQDSGPLEDSFGSVGGHSLCHRKAQRHVPYTCSRPRMKQKCNVIKQTRKHRYFACQTKVPVTTCSPVEKTDATTCYRAARKAMEYSCVKPTEVEECVPVPAYIAGKCFEQEEYKEAYECTETQVRQKCEDLEKEVASRCDKLRNKQPSQHSPWLTQLLGYHLQLLNYRTDPASLRYPLTLQKIGLVTDHVMMNDSRLPPSHVVELNDIGNQHRKYYNTDPSRVLPPVPPSPLPPVAFHSLAPSEDHHAHDVVLIEHQRDRSEARSPVSDDGSPAPLAPLAPGSPVPSLLFDVPSPSLAQPSGENNDNGSKYSQSGHNRNSQGLSGDGAAAPHSDFQPEKLRELLESLLSELRIEEKNLTRTMNNTDADNGPVDDLAQELELIRDDIGVVEDGLSRLERKDLSNTEMQSLWQFLLGDNASSMEGVSPDSDASEADDVYGTKKDAEPTLDSATIEPNPHYMNSAHDHMPMNATQPVFPEDRVGSVALAAAAAALHKAMEISFASPNTSGHHQLQLKKMSPHVAASPREALMAAILQGAFEIKARILRSMQAIQQLLETADMPTDREKEAEDLLEGLKRDMEKMHQIVDRVKAGELSLSDLQYIAIQLEAIRQEVKTSDVAQAESSSQYPSNLRPTSERANFPSAGMLRSQLEQGNLDGQLDPGSVTDLPFAGKGIPSSQGTGAVAFESDRAEPSSEKENRNFLTPPARTNVYITINIDESGSVTSGR
ncbi:conserved hypothetical protein [Neospora caninum Liverpool]|uniref:Uncharacterized protein n=1 Tax=Neospora caninum (strain Liverpool) TaxID=572307 RepID=F0V9L0_NEOCL|nr:conserved hypothetical protein [Neospora caninum Liverpool]CBZ50436.1 conserved hypothetical protein [Neospora caninum Liverpool]|eukprot:XP_003880469.1 conserved hypothetical protein [Neospora caninum Liverpool]